MKKLLMLSVLAMALFATEASALIGNVGKSNNFDYAKVVIPGSVERQYINVKNSHTAPISAGMAAVLDTTADDGASVVISATSGLAPVCIMPQVCLVGAICKCQVYGELAAALFDGGSLTTFFPIPSVAGQSFWMSTANAGYISMRAIYSAQEVRGGIFYDAVSVSGNAQVFINLL